MISEAKKKFDFTYFSPEFEERGLEQDNMVFHAELIARGDYLITFIDEFGKPQETIYSGGPVNKYVNDGTWKVL